MIRFDVTLRAADQPALNLDLTAPDYPRALSTVRATLEAFKWAYTEGSATYDKRTGELTVEFTYADESLAIATITAKEVVQ